MTKMTRDQMEAFWAFADKNKDDCLTVQELKAAVNGYRKQQGQKPLDDQEICAMFMDITGQGKSITKAKFMEEMEKPPRGHALVEKFHEYDKDGSGTLSHSEIVQLAADAGYGPDTAADIIASADSNNDGVLSLAEFKKSVGC